jgi:ATP-binding cassette subfamily B protein
LLLIATLPEFIASNRYGRDIWSISASQSEDRRTLWELRNHYTYLPSLMELRLFQNLIYFKKKIISLYNKFFQQQLSNEKRRTQSLLITQIGSQTVTALIGVYFIFQVTQDQLSIGGLTFLITSVGRFRDALSGLLFHLSAQYQDSLFVADFFQLQQLPSSLDYSKVSLVLPAHQTPTIQFHNLSFSYPNTSTPILHHINLTIPPGSHVALVGANGAGKTTLIKLLCRFYDPTAGKITINGTDLKQINLSSWYQLLGILSQEYAHFRLKARENIILGNISQTHLSKHIIEAAKKASAHAFITKWPGQYHQQLGRDFTDGIEPSVGQWQKLALARLFYKNPKIYILDEPTSSLDPEAEAHIFKKLHTLAQDQTTISISHRFNTVKKASQIVVIKDGSIIEQGPHQKLLSLKGTYARMYTTQAKEYQE